MTITPTRFYRLALLIPYLMIFLFLPFFYLGMKPAPDETSQTGNILIQTLNTSVGFLAGIVAIISFVYIFGLVNWLIPYTVLVVGLWLWSLKKTKSQIYKMFLWSPVFLAFLMTAFQLLASYSNWFDQWNFLGEDILSGSLYCLFPASIAFGYLFIGMTAWIYSFFLRTGRMIDHEIS